MNARHHVAALVVAVALALPATPVLAQDEDIAAPLAQRLVALEANPEYADVAEFERLQARQALEALRQAGSREREAARYVAERRVEIAEVAAETAAMRRETDRLAQLRSELLIEASRREAARARAEAERLRIQAQIQAEETARLRREMASDNAVMQDVEAALEGVAGDQAAKLRAAREREAELARQEAELLRQIEQAEATAAAAEAQADAAADGQADADADADPADEGGN